LYIRPGKQNKSEVIGHLEAESIKKGMIK